VAASLALAGGASARRADPPGHPDGNHCINIFGVDLNQVYGVSDQFVIPGCQVVTAGEHWLGSAILIFAKSDFVYPPGYVPARTNPIDDFLSKLTAVKVVVDGGTPYEKTYAFAPADVVRTDVTADQILPGVFDPGQPLASLLPRMSPLQVGDHRFKTILVLNAETCDGFTTSETDSCLPAGAVPVAARPFTVDAPTGS
jgi:hypothetical protein